MSIKSVKKKFRHTELCRTNFKYMYIYICIFYVYLYIEYFLLSYVGIRVRVGQPKTSRVHVLFGSYGFPASGDAVILPSCDRDETQRESRHSSIV